MLRLLATMALLAFAPCRGLALAGDVAETPPEQTTAVHGTVPDLTGHWLVLSYIAVGNNVRTVAALWDVTASDGTPHVEVRFVALPEALQASLDQANDANARWEPSEQQLQDLRNAWATLAPETRGAAKVETMIDGRDAFDDVLKKDETVKDSQFAIRQMISYLPGAQRPIKDVLVYGVTDQLPDGYGGKYVSASIAAAPFPVPITFKGTFRMHRLESVQARGLLARLLDMFSGCGRSRR
jgi:hypothetical protein